MLNNLDIIKLNKNFKKNGFVKIKGFLPIKKINSINNDIKTVTKLLINRKKNINIYILQAMER